MERDTVGKISTELKSKSSDNSHSAHDQMNENLSEYAVNIYQCIDTHKKIFPEDFYIEVQTKTEKLLTNVIRNFFMGKLACPTPQYDQCVYKYNKKDETILFLWVIPDRNTVEYMVNNIPYLPTEEYELLNYILKFRDGELDKLARHLNNEEENV